MSPLPTGVVSILLADVEESSALWEHDGDAMADAIRRLNRLLDATAEAHDGVRPLEQGEGDGFVLAFARASDAVHAATALQRELADGALRIRIGIHTGEVRVRDGRYYEGPTMNRAGRVRDLACGGETVLTQATRDVAADALDPDLEVVDIGVRTMRGMGRPERLFVVRGPGLRQVRTAVPIDALVPNNLPEDADTFVGRAAELSVLDKLLDDVRVLTLTGPGGAGKTRLALQLARRAMARHTDGVWLVELATIADPSLVASAVLTALGRREDGGLRATESLTGQLAGHRALLVLDNCEHVAEACADLVTQLVARCPTIGVLATSRVPLASPGEVTWPVPALAVPAETGALGDIAGCESVRLFVDRALRARPNFELSPDNAGDVATICQRLDGLPLAIELAAARARVLAPSQILSGLDDGFRTLAPAGRRAPDRHQTLRACVAWSHDLLDDAERTMLRRLAVFRGWFGLDDAEAVVAGDGIERLDVLDLLTSLADRSLVVVDTTADPARYRLLETIRAFATEHLDASGDDVATHRRHLLWFRDLAARAERGLIGRDQVAWTGAVDRHLDDMLAAIAWSAADDAEQGLRLAVSLWPYWCICGRLLEGANVIAAARRAVEAPPADLEGWASWAETYLRFSGTLERPSGLDGFSLALERARESGDARLEAAALSALGSGYVAFEIDTAIPLLQEAVGRSREIGDDWFLADTLQMLGTVYTLPRPDRDRAVAALDEAAAVSARTGNRWLGRWTEFTFGLLEVQHGDLDAAVGRLTNGLDGARSDGDRWACVVLQGALATLQALRGDIPAARALLDDLPPRTEDLSVMARTFVVVAEQVIAMASGDELDDEAVDRLVRMWPAMAQMPGFMASRAALAFRFRRGIQSRSLIDELVAECRETSAGARLLEALLTSADLARREGDLERATNEALEALDLLEARPNPLQRVEALELVAGLRIVTGQSVVDAVRVLAACESARKDMGYPRWPQVQDRIDEDMHAAADAVGEDAIASALHEGAGLSLPEAFAFARRGRGRRNRPATGWDSLTPAERDVARLVAEGLSNPEIAERLLISRRTVTTHLTRVFDKVGVRNRAELAVTAAQRAGS